MVFINESQSVGIILEAATNNLTGSLALTIFLLVIFLGVMIFLMFKIPMEIGMPLIFPLVLGSMAEVSGLLLVGGTIMFFLAAIITRFLFLNK